MTPVRKYVEANVTSGKLRAEVHYRQHPTAPALMVEMKVSGAPILTIDALRTFTAEVESVAEEEVRQVGGGSRGGGE